MVSTSIGVAKLRGVEGADIVDGGAQRGALLDREACSAASNSTAARAAPRA
jgi:hypothetical protein